MRTTVASVRFQGPTRSSGCSGFERRWFGLSLVLELPDSSSPRSEFTITSCNKTDDGKSSTYGLHV